MDTFATCIAGFISIDCGISGTGYEDDKTKIFYSPDAGFIDDDAGTNHDIPAKYMHTLNGNDLHNVRSFAGTRSCYTHWWKKGLQSRFVKAINPGFRNRD
jgi:hypothetical protein